MIPDIVRRLFGRWAQPIGGIPPGVTMPLRWLALLPRLYAGIIFILYGYDKLLGGNRVYTMDAAFFRAVGVPFPELTQVLIGALELFGGLALLAGLLTPVFAFLLAANMVVALLTVGNGSVEALLLLACLVLMVTGGGMIALDQLIDRRLAARRPAVPLAAPGESKSPGRRT